MISASNERSLEWRGRRFKWGIERWDDEEVKLKSVGVSAANGSSISFHLSFGMPSLALASAKSVLKVPQPLSPADKKKQPCCASRMAGNNSRSADGFRT